MGEFQFPQRTLQSSMQRQPREGWGFLGRSAALSRIGYTFGISRFPLRAIQRAIQQILTLPFFLIAFLDRPMPGPTLDE